MGKISGFDGPALAPRPFVVRPDIRFSLPTKEETTLFISSPLWIKIRLGQPAVEVFDKPIYQPSDTWFGPSTIEGELCYAGRTRARLHMEQLDRVSHRVHSAIRIKNLSSSGLDLERLKLPMPNLSPFAAKDGRLWTETIRLDRREDGNFAELRLDKKPPVEVQPTELVGGPRDKAEKGVLLGATGILTVAIGFASQTSASKYTGAVTDPFPVRVVDGADEASTDHPDTLI